MESEQNTEQRKLEPLEPYAPGIERCGIRSNNKDPNKDNSLAEWLEEAEAETQGDEEETNIEKDAG